MIDPLLLEVRMMDSAAAGHYTSAYRELLNVRAELRADADTNTVHMRGVFVDDAFDGYAGAITVAAFERSIDTLDITPGDELRIIVDSPGGMMVTSQYLMREIARYDTTVEARARLYSAATHMAMGAKRIVGVEGSEYLFHYPWAMAVGNYRDFEKYGRELRQSAETLENLYLKRAGDALDRDVLHALMSDNTIITAEHAAELGLIDEIVEATDTTELDQRAQRILPEPAPTPEPPRVEPPSAAIIAEHKAMAQRRA